MFNTRIVIELSDNTKVILPDSFRILPYFYVSCKYIPSYAVEDEEYGIRIENNIDTNLFKIKIYLKYI